MAYKSRKSRINLLMGKKKPTPRKPKIEAVPPKFPVRGFAQGKSSGSLQGVGGWRTGHYRGDGVKLDGSDYSSSYLEFLKGGRS